MVNVNEFLIRAGFLIWPWLFVFGACTGSFLNVVVYRLRRGKAFRIRARAARPAGIRSAGITTCRS